MRLIMFQAKRILGDRVQVVVALDSEEQIMALRAYFPELSMEENYAQMTNAIEAMAKD